MAVKVQPGRKSFLRSDDSRKIPLEPNWLTGDLGRYPFTFEPTLSFKGKVEEPIQQSDILKPLMDDITTNGLTYAYFKYKEGKPDPRYIHKPTKHPSHVIVVGAGMAGLSAAYELAQVGHKVTILEMQERVGGRVKTFGQKEGFAKGLHVEAGAMRLPCAPDAVNKTHYLTDGYATTFTLNRDYVKFVNSNDNAFLKFYNKKPIRIKDWKQSDFDDLWPKWKDTLTGNGHADQVKSIDDYYDQVTGVVTDQLRRNLAGITNPSHQAKVWHDWIDCWSRFTLESFLRSTLEVIRLQIPPEFDNRLDKLGWLLPWPDDAVIGYSVFTYTEQLDQCLVQYLRDQLGEWWSPKMHHIKGGMSKLPEAFTKPNVFGWNKEVHLQDNITFNVTVNEIDFDTSGHTTEQTVVVKGYYTNSGRPFEVTGNAVIVTTPVHIIRQIKFNALKCTTPLPDEFYQAIENLWYGPATKIMIQSKTRFWETEDPETNIQGGFSRTSIPIGQIHYPSNPDGHTIEGDRGILLCYTWKSEALLFGALSPIVAIYEVVRQIAQIHPEITENFEMGAIEAWYNEPSAQGAYAVLKPNQFKSVRCLMLPYENLYFAGEAISFTSGWIQGALESGLRAAYEFYARNERLHDPRK